MIIVDDIVEYPAKMTIDKGLPGRHWCHMISTLADLEAAEAELREMAVRIGMGAHWIQHQGKPTVHYDLTPSLRDRAVRAGAVEINAYEFARARLNGQAAVEALVNRKSARPVVGVARVRPDEASPAQRGPRAGRNALGEDTTKCALPTCRIHSLTTSCGHGKL